MPIIKAMFYGIIQGLTEFLPVSSSGHLVIFQKLEGLIEPPIFFDIVVHLGTLVAVLIYFYKDYKRIKLEQIKLILIGSIPIVLIGLLIQPRLNSIFNSLNIVGGGLLITGSLLILSSLSSEIYKSKKRINFLNISVFQALVIGSFQAIAIFPGVSRSGVTIAIGLLLGLRRKAAFYFSFLLAIPAILGAQGLELFKMIFSRGLGLQYDFSQISIGFISALMVGFISLKLLDLVIFKSKIYYFGYYCLILGVVVLRVF